MISVLMAWFGLSGSQFRTQNLKPVDPVKSWSQSIKDRWAIFQVPSKREIIDDTFKTYNLKV